MNLLEMPTEELVNFIKSQGLDAQSSFGQFVKARSLRPEISMKEFLKIWKHVPGIVKVEPVLPFKPTHVLKENFPGAEPKIIELVKKTKTLVSWRSAFGTGSTPQQFVDSLETIKE